MWRQISLYQVEDEARNGLRSSVSWFGSTIIRLSRSTVYGGRRLNTPIKIAASIDRLCPLTRS